MEYDYSNQMDKLRAWTDYKNETVRQIAEFKQMEHVDENMAL